jgi:anti-sigma regulatory factor (Ser/Thr protein kinase)
MESLRLPGELASLKPIRDFVAAVAAKAGLDKLRAYRLTLAVDEIATNVVVHGYNEAGLVGDILLHVTCTEESIEVIVEDMGRPYNPLLHKVPDNLEAQLADRDIGGLGVFMALRSVDEFRYEYADGSNRNIFVMMRSAEN